MNTITHRSNFGRGNPEVEAKRRAALVRANARPETRAKISEARKREWASGARKKNSPESYKKAGESIRLGYLMGTRKEDPEEVRRRAINNLKNVNPHKQIEANRRLGAERLGKEMPATTKNGKPSKVAKSPNHWKAKHWWFKHHSGAEIKGRNLSELVRRNNHLFDPEDVIWVKSKCKARTGLNSLTLGRVNGPTVWKGWTVGWIPKWSFTAPSPFPPTPPASVSPSAPAS